MLREAAYIHMSLDRVERAEGAEQRPCRKLSVKIPKQP